VLQIFYDLFKYKFSTNYLWTDFLIWKERNGAKS